MCELACQIIQKKQEDKRIKEEQAANARYWKIPACCDDDDNYNSAITPVLSTEETENSLSMRDEHLDTIPATESDEVIKSSVEDLVPIPSEFEGIPNTMCDVHLVNNPTPLEANDHFEIVINSNDDISSSDDDYLYNENIEYVEASPHDSELVSLEAAEIFPPTNRSDFAHEEFADELAHIISPPEYDSFYFGNLPDPGELISILNSRIRENLYSTTLVNLPVEDDHFPLLAYVVWIFLAYLTCPIIPPYLHSFGNEDTIFDPGIIINHFFRLSQLSSIPENLKTLAKGFYPPSLHFLSFNWESNVLRDGEACKQCTCAKCGSGFGKGHCYICGHNQNSLNDSPSISKTSSQSPPNIDHCCYECGDLLDGIFCKQCTCKSCGKGAHIGYNCP
nr:hypothetical protein [Tanacetum cinerariifolium]